MKLKFLVAAALAAIPNALSAQTVTSSPGRNYYTVGQISSSVNANELFGVTVTAYWGLSSTAYAFRQLDALTYGWSDGDLTITGLGVTPTYTVPWALNNKKTGSRLTRLVFDAGSSNFLFDRGTRSLLPEGSTGGTPGSGSGFDFCDVQIGTCAVAIRGDKWDTQVLYTNQVAVNPNAPAGDLYRTMDVSFGNNGIDWVNPKLLGVTQPADAYIKFDVDVSSWVVVPEPSTSVLMATGLLAVGLVSRRRRTQR
jgi:hypothetical protein